MSSRMQIFFAMKRSTSRHMICRIFAVTILESPIRRVARPLSASRRSNKEKQDSSHEAKAVAEAVKAENQRLSDLKRNTHSAPGRHQVSGEFWVLKYGIVEINNPFCILDFGRILFS